MKVINILCEGQTEQRFALKVLKPYLLPYDIIVRAELLSERNSQNNGGGMVSYDKTKRDIDLMIRSNRDNSFEKNYFTTMVDLYALPLDFPGYVNRPQDAYLWVNNIENALAADINHSRFIPYIELHEFETLVICNPSKLQSEYPNSAKSIEKMDAKWHKDVGDNPELVNTQRTTSPSHRIISALEEHYRYDKVKSGTSVTSDIGIDALRAMCKHFNEWIEKLIVC